MADEFTNAQYPLNMIGVCKQAEKVVAQLEQ
jgi:hypothetical protein